MTIKINKKSDNTIVFFMNKNSYEFSFDNISKIINYSVSHIDEKIDIIDLTEEKELSNYIELINKVIAGSRTDDFITAVKNANDAKEKLKNAEDETI